tara:strand:+ start:9511 stop:9837 length:327 start_codon:yes stop_codon:yes gene_type:complete
MTTKLSKSVPAKVEEYAESVKEKNPDYDDAQVWATAWSIYCKYKNPSSDHCKKDTSEYFPGKKEAEVEAGSDLSKSWGGYSTFRPMRHAHQETLIKEWGRLCSKNSSN